MTAHEMTLYRSSIEPAAEMLGTMRDSLTHAKEFVSSRSAEEAPLLQSRVIFDMLPLVKQVQIASDTAKGLAARLAGIEIPKFEDSETTLDALIARIDKTLEFLKTITPDMVNGREDELITYPYDSSKSLYAADYARRYALPNFYFHVVTAYNILRMNGVLLGKSVYMGTLPFIEIAA